MRSIKELPTLLWISIIFLLSQTFAYLLGIRFAGSLNIIINPFWQYLDSQILKTDLLRGLFFLHSQPPLFNWFLGVILKLFPQHYELAFDCIFRALGFGVLLLMAIIMQGLSLNRILILIFCTLFAFFPNFLIYTNLLFYTLPIAFLLLLSCFFLQKFVRTKSSKYVHFFVWTSAVIMLTRSIYHLAWFLIIVAMLIAINRNQFGFLLRAAVLPTLVVALLYAKNDLIGGSLGPGSWMGMNLGRGWILPNPSMRNFGAFLERDEVQKLVNENKINSEWLIGPFMDPAAYKNLGYFKPTANKHPAIGSPEKGSGFPNFNHADYAKISKKMLASDLEIISNYPKKYLARIWLSLQLYLQPGTGPSWFLVQSYDYSEVEKYRNLATLVLFQGRPIELARGYIGWNSLYILFPLIIIFGFKKTLQRNNNSEVSNNRVVYCHITFTVVWVAIVTNLLEFGENNRIRFETDPFIVILFAVAIQALFKKGFSRRSSPIVVEGP